MTTIAATKMNAFYIGMENPITVVASGADYEHIKVGAQGLRVTKVGRYNYRVTAHKAGMAKIIVSNSKTGSRQEFPFAVKRMGRAVVRLGGKTDGVMGSGEMTAPKGLVVTMDNTDYDAKCTISSFSMWYNPKNSEPIEYLGRGGRFRWQILEVIQKAKPGDHFAFTNIKARVPNSCFPRVNSLSFKVG